MSTPYDPFAAPGHDAGRPPPPPPGARPAVLTWFTVYCVFMALGSLMLVLLSPLMMLVPPEPDELPPAAMAGIFVCVGLPFTVLYGAGPFLPRRPWAWIYDLVVICFGLTSCCTLPFCVALLVAWLKPEVKAWYGRPA